MKSPVIAPVSRAPSYLIDFVGNGATAPASVQCSRAAGGATYFDDTGTLQFAAANTPRIDYGPTDPQITNSIRNSVCAGSVMTWSGATLFDSTGNAVAGSDGANDSTTIIGCSFPATMSIGTPLTITMMMSASNPSGLSQGRIRLVPDAGSEPGVPTYPTLTDPTGTQVYLTAGQFLGTVHDNALTTTPAPYTFTATCNISSPNGIYWLVWSAGPGTTQSWSYGSTDNGTNVASQYFVGNNGGSALLPASNSVGPYLFSVSEGSVGALPTYWGFLNNSSGTLQADVVGTGSELGIPYVDLRIHGTTGATAGNFEIDLEQASFGGLGTVAGDPWTATAFVKMQAGSMSNIGTLQVYIKENVNGTFQAGSGTVFTPTNSALNAQRYATTRTVTTASGATVQPCLTATVSTNVSIDITLRVGAPQIEKLPYANNWLPTNGSVFTAGPSPLGLLIEDQRLNVTVNPRGEGATVGVIGSGGALPTNWGLFNTSGLSLQIVGNGTESGLPYTDLRIYGTSTNNIVRISPALTPTAAAASGQTWMSSAYVRLVAGSFSQISTIALGFWIETSSNALAELSETAIPFPTGIPLTRQRAAVSHTITASTAALITQHLALGLATSGATVDVTLRFAGWQLEQGPYATSVILPPAGSPAATWRQLDVITAPSLGWFKPDAPGSLAVSFQINQPTPAGRSFGIVSVSDDASNYIRMRITASGSTAILADVVNNGMTEPAGVQSATAWNVGSINKVAQSWSTTGQAISLNGSLATASGLLALPGNETVLRPGQWPGGSNNLVGTIQRIEYWPRALPNNELVEVTT